MPSTGEKRAEQERRRRIAAAAAANELEQIPPIFDIERRIRCERDPKLWLTTYLPQVYFVAFGESQERFIDEAWTTILDNGSKNIEAYRGFGKTSILSGLLLLCLLTGRIRHAYYIVAEGGRMAKQASQWFSSALYEEYDKKPEDARAIVADYPEVCYPIQRRRGVANKPLKYRGEPCDIVISPERIRLPTIKGSPSSGSTVVFASIHSPLRGASVQIRGEGSFRVGAVMFDDIQTDANARSEKETSNIVETVKSSISFLSGKDKEGKKEPLTILSAITQNRPADVAERIRTELPELNSITIPFLKSTPIDFSPWRKYREYRSIAYRKAAGDTQAARRALNGYYMTHRQEIEHGVVVDDPRIHEPSQLGAIQYAVEKWCDSERAFWCELQNDARRGEQEAGGGLIPETIIRATREDCGQPLERLTVPTWASILTAHIDVGDHYLNYCTLATAENASAFHVVDFGTFPEQGAIVSKKKYFHDIQEIYDGSRLEKIARAIYELLDKISSLAYNNINGEFINVDILTGYQRHARADNLPRRFQFLSVIGVDASSGEQGEAIWTACQRFNLDKERNRGRAVPCYGTAARSRHVRYYPLKRGEWRRTAHRVESACDWIESPESRREILLKYRNGVPCCFLYDANTYKTRRDEAFRQPPDTIGSCTIFKPRDDYEREEVVQFAQHNCSEEIVREKRLDGLTYNEWEEKSPRVSDNEFLDTLSGCFALANWVGVEDNVRKTKSRKVEWS